MLALLTHLFRDQQAYLTSNVHNLIDRSHDLEVRLTERLESLQAEQKKVSEKTLEETRQLDALLREMNVQQKLAAEETKIQPSIKQFESLRAEQNKLAQQRLEETHQIHALLREIPVQQKLAIEGIKIQPSVKLLESLRYKFMYARKSEVKQEHAETFR